MPHQLTGESETEAEWGQRGRKLEAPVPQLTCPGGQSTNSLMND